VIARKDRYLIAPFQIGNKNEVPATAELTAQRSRGHFNPDHRSACSLTPDRSRDPGRTAYLATSRGPRVESGTFRRKLVQIFQTFSPWVKLCLLVKASPLLDSSNAPYCYVMQQILIRIGKALLVERLGASTQDSAVREMITHRTVSILKGIALNLPHHRKA